jgi:transcription elongation factor GreB
MSKAFTNEDTETEEVEPVRSAPSGKNYITPAGFKALVDELNDLKTRERPEVTRTVAWAAGNGDRSENADYQYGKRRLREIDRRIHFLSKRIEIAEVVDPASPKDRAVVQFGATVTYRNEEGDERTVQIVGVDEADLAKGTISWVSPIGRALLKGRVDDVVTFQSPKGPSELEILEITYPK